MKQVTCQLCGRKMYVKLRIGEREFKDGYHGECKAQHCGFWYFEEVNCSEPLTESKEE